MTLVYNLLLNSKVLIWRESGNWTRPYCLLAVKNEICYIQLPSRLTSFRSTSVKPYFRSKNTCNVELDKLEVPAELDKLKALAELDKLKAPLPTLKVL
jgi:hypothetical protein